MADDHAHSDMDDIRRARVGDEDALARIVRRHWPMAWRTALAITGRRALAEEVVQEAFISAIGALERYDASRPLAPWLSRIVTNAALNVVRSERRLVLRAEPDRVDWAEEGSDHDELLAAVASLGYDQRVVIALRYWLDHEPREIAELLDLSIGTVNSRLGRARAELRSLLEVEDAGRS